MKHLYLPKLQVTLVRVTAGALDQMANTKITQYKSFHILY